MRPLFVHLLVAFIHEMGHISASIFLKVRVEKLTVLPFGFFSEIPELEHIHVLKELCIVAAGPLMYFTNQAVLLLLFQTNTISLHLMQQGMEANNIVLLFNLLPIYPLDGYRISSIIMSFFLTYKVSKKINVILSLFSLLIMIYLGFTSANIIVYCYLIFMQVYFIMRFREMYLSFIVSRLRTSIYKKAIFNRRKDFIRPYDNVFMKNGHLLSEKEYALELLSKKH